MRFRLLGPFEIEADPPADDVEAELARLAGCGSR
jgi:hypothetical protein